MTDNFTKFGVIVAVVSNCLGAYASDAGKPNCSTIRRVFSANSIIEPVSRNHQQRSGTLETDIGRLREEISSLQRTIRTLEAQVKRRDDTISTLRRRNARLNSQLDMMDSFRQKRKMMGENSRLEQENIDLQKQVKMLKNSEQELEQKNNALIILLMSQIAQVQALMERSGDQ